MVTSSDMLTPHDQNTTRHNLAYLQEESLAIVVTLSGLLGYAWLWIDIWPITGSHLSASAWIGALALIAGALLGYSGRKRFPRLAAYLVSLNLLLATTCAVISFDNAGLIYLFTLPIIFASVILSRRGLFIIALLSGAIVWLLGTINPLPSAAEGLLPITILICLTITSWLSARNLHTTLAWFGDAFASAYHNARISREHEAELRIVLKSLDEMTYRLERANFTLTQERNHAEEARRLKQQFAQTISHELRTPLNIVVAFTDLMAQSPDYYGLPLPAPYMRDLSIIHRNARHLQMLVNDVLDLARIEAAQMIVTPELTNPVDLVQEAVQTARSLVETRGLELRVQFGDDLPLVMVDTTRIRQVLFNLLNNAARFTDRGTITVQVERQADEVIFSVRDTGLGITASDIPRLFVEFQQLNSGTDRQHGGAGLGLAISRRFVELHHGRIWVESQPGKGSVFSFALPIRGQSLATAAPVDDWPPLLGEGAARAGQRIVLIVTRSPSAVLLLSRHLNDCQTLVAATFAEAQPIIARIQPQCVVIDTAHDELQIASLQTLAQTWALGRTPLIACPLPGEALMQQQLAVTGYLIKPVSAQTIHDLLQQLDSSIERVLVIDDNRDFTLMLTRLLSRPAHAYRVVCAYNGTEGLALLEHHQPQLIFMDLHLPDINGVQVIERIRTRPGFETIPIVVLSGEEKLDTPSRQNAPLVVVRGTGISASDIIVAIQTALDKLSFPA